MPQPHVMDGALMRQNRVLVLIYGHTQSRVKEFFLTDGMQAVRPLLLSTMHRELLAAGPAASQSDHRV